MKVFTKQTNKEIPKYIVKDHSGLEINLEATELNIFANAMKMDESFLSTQPLHMRFK